LDAIQEGTMKQIKTKQSLQIIAEGSGELVGWRDPDENRLWIREHKPRGLIDKHMTVQEAVERFVRDGDYLAVGGFGHVRTPMALIYEIVRQRRGELVVAGKTAVHDIDILIGGGCVSKVECAYAFGHEIRGLSPCGRRAVESGQVQVVAEISNAGYQWRFLAGMMGVPFIPARTMIGTDTFEKSACKLVEDPWSGKPVLLVPAAYPDVVLLHVPRCDRYGNAQIDGILVEDFELARAGRRLILSTEKVVDETFIRGNPRLTAIPYYLVDAVCEIPYGAHPVQMPYLYFFDERHIAEWLRMSKSEEGTQEYLDCYVYEAGDFGGYLERVGGAARMAELRRLEEMCACAPCDDEPDDGREAFDER
jgi:acyl CoA:acetate/3-ketoacid CoA transferase alpha subunit